MTHNDFLAIVTSDNYTVFFLDMFLFSIIFTFPILAISVTSVRHTAYSIFSIISLFFIGVIIFGLLQAEFLAYMLSIVYVGAISIFSLFTVMMVQFEHVRIARIEEIILTSFCGILLFSWFIQLLPENTDIFGFVGECDNHFFYTTAFASKSHENQQVFDALAGFHETLRVTDRTNTKQFCLVLYTHYSVVLIVSGFVLLIALFRCVTLTNAVRGLYFKRQCINDQQFQRNKIIRIFENAKNNHVT